MLTQEEILERRNFIGGSDVPIILGLSNYKTPLVLYLEKTGVLEIEAKEETPAQKWGRLNEPLIRAEFEKRHGILVPELNKQYHPEYAFIRGNLDGFNEERNLVWEGKMSSAFMKHAWGEEGTDVIPAEYLCQIATYCSIKNANDGFLTALIGVEERDFYYGRDRDLEGMVIEATINFWDCVQQRREPDPVNMDDCRIKFRSTDPEKTIMANDDSLLAYARLGSLKAEMNHLEEKQSKLKMEIMCHMKDAELLVDGYGVPLVTWKANKKGTRTFLMKGV